MTDYGHSFVNGRNFHIDSWGHGPLFLEVGGKVHRFEDSDRFGPSKLNKNGDISANPSWPERHPFWRAHSLWVKQGRRTADDGRTCLWDEPEDYRYD